MTKVDTKPIKTTKHNLIFIMYELQKLFKFFLLLKSLIDNKDWAIISDKMKKTIINFLIILKILLSNSTPSNKTWKKRKNAEANPK